MKIIYIGQLGLPLLNEKDKTSPESRVELLARQLARPGRQITVLGTKPYITNHGNYHGIKLISLPSLNPTKPGGWIYLLLSLITLWRQQPNVIHLQGWRSAALIRLITALSPDSTRLLTVDTLPRTNRFIAKYVARQADKWCHSITTPTRQTQYWLLQNFGLHTTYIPDGFSATTVPHLPLKHFKLRKNQYHLVFVNSPRALRLLAKSYLKISSRKRLVVCQEPTASYSRIKKQFSNITFVGPQQGRALNTLINNAAAVIAADQTDPNRLLTAMNAGRVIVATTDALHQETLGVSALYFKPKDEAGLIHALNTANQLAPARRLGRQAQQRAQRHFTIERTTADYISAYHSYTIPVPLDSVRAVSFTKLPA